MIRLVEALGFRALKFVHQPLDRFQILVGPNASGKSTFLGAVDLIGKLVDAPRDIAQPLRELSPNFRDLTFMRGGTRFELAVEALIPARLRALKENGEPNGPDLVRYEVSLGESEPTGAISVIGETLWLRGAANSHPSPAQRALFPAPPPRQTIWFIRNASSRPRAGRRSYRRPPATTTSYPRPQAGMPRSISGETASHLLICPKRRLVSLLRSGSGGY